MDKGVVLSVPNSYGVIDVHQDHPSAIAAGYFLFIFFSSARGVDVISLKTGKVLTVMSRLGSLNATTARWAPLVPGLSEKDCVSAAVIESVVYMFNPLNPERAPCKKIFIRQPPGSTSLTFCPNSILKRLNIPERRSSSISEHTYYMIVCMSNFSPTLWEIRYALKYPESKMELVNEPNPLSSILKNCKGATVAAWSQLYDKLYLSIGNKTGEVVIFDFQNEPISIIHSRTPILHIDWSDMQNELVVTSADNVAKIYSIDKINSSSEIGKFVSVKATNAKFLPNAYCIVLLSTDNTIQLFRLYSFSKPISVFNEAKLGVITFSLKPVTNQLDFDIICSMRNQVVMWKISQQTKDIVSKPLDFLSTEMIDNSFEAEIKSINLANINFDKRELEKRRIIIDYYDRRFGGEVVNARVKVMATVPEMYPYAPLIFTILQSESNISKELHIQLKHALEEVVANNVNGEYKKQQLVEAANAIYDVINNPTVCENESETLPCPRYSGGCFSPNGLFFMFSLNDNPPRRARTHFDFLNLIEERSVEKKSESEKSSSEQNEPEHNADQLSVRDNSNVINSAQQSIYSQPNTHQHVEHEAISPVNTTTALGISTNTKDDEPTCETSVNIDEQEAFIKRRESQFQDNLRSLISVLKSNSSMETRVESMVPSLPLLLSQKEHSHSISNSQSNEQHSRETKIKKGKSKYFNETVRMFFDETKFNSKLISTNAETLIQSKVKPVLAPTSFFSSNCALSDISSILYASKDRIVQFESAKEETKLSSESTFEFVLQNIISIVAETKDVNWMNRLWNPLIEDIFLQAERRRDVQTCAHAAVDLWSTELQKKVLYSYCVINEKLNESQKNVSQKRGEKGDDALQTIFHSCLFSSTIPKSFMQLGEKTSQKNDEIGNSELYQPFLISPMRFQSINHYIEAYCHLLFQWEQYDKMTEFLEYQKFEIDVQSAFLRFRQMRRQQLIEEKKEKPETDIIPINELEEDTFEKEKRLKKEKHFTEISNSLITHNLKIPKNGLLSTSYNMPGSEKLSLLTRPISEERVRAENKRSISLKPAEIGIFVPSHESPKIEAISNNSFVIPELELVCSICLIPIDTFFVKCEKCLHIGHAQHYRDWFKDQSVCPFMDCNCVCSTTESAKCVEK